MTWSSNVRPEVWAFSTTEETNFSFGLYFVTILNSLQLTVVMGKPLPTYATENFLYIYMNLGHGKAYEK